MWLKPPITRPVVLGQAGRIACVLLAVGGILTVACFLLSSGRLAHDDIGARERLVVLPPLVVLAVAVALALTSWQDEPPAARRLRLALVSSALVWIAIPYALLVPFHRPLLGLAVILGCPVVSWKSLKVSSARTRKLRSVMFFAALVMGVPVWLCDAARNLELWGVLPRWPVEDVAVLFYPLIFLASIVLVIWALRQKLRPLWAAIVVFLGVHFVFLSSSFGLSTLFVIVLFVPVGIVIAIVLLLRAASQGVRPAWTVICVSFSIALEILSVALAVLALLAVAGAVR